MTRLLTLALAAVLTLVAPGCAWDGTWEVPTPGLPRMLAQPRYDAYESSAFFDDGMAMRLPPEGSVAYMSLASRRAPRLDRELLARGRTQYEVFCAPCHGFDGLASTPVAEDMALRPPPSLQQARIRALSDAQVVDVITDGYGLMPSYAGRIPPEDRWATVAYVRALQLSFAVPREWLPEDRQRALRREGP